MKEEEKHTEIVMWLMLEKKLRKDSKCKLQAPQ